MSGNGDAKNHIARHCEKATRPTKQSTTFQMALDCFALLAMTIMLFAFLTLPAHAQCTNPAGNEAAAIYNKDGQIMQYCDGTDWKPMGPRKGSLPEDGLVGWWRLNESGNTSTAFDSIGSNNGTLTNFPADPSANWQSAVLENGLDFDGTDDHVILGDIDYGPGNQITVSAWFRATSCSGDAGICYIVSKDQFGSSTPYTLAYVGDGFIFWVNGVGASYYPGPTAATNGQWHNLTGTYNGSQMQLFLNGRLVATNTATPLSNNESVTIGSSEATPTYRPADAIIDDVRIYNRVLSAEEIAQCCHTPEASSLTTNLVGHWKLDETSGTTVIDYISSNNGTMNGGLDAGSDSVDGRVKTALAFDGVGDEIIINKDSSLDNLGPMSTSTWIYPLSSPIGSTYIGTQRSGGLQGWRVDLTDGGFGYGYIGFLVDTTSSNPNNYERYGLAPLKLNTWHHIVTTWDGDITDETTAKIYVDGKEAFAYFAPNGVSGTYDDSGHDLYIGAWDGGDNFDGYVDDVRIYDRILSADEVAQLYAARDGHTRYNADGRVPEFFNGDQWVPMGPPLPTTTGLVGHWKLDEDSGTFVDSSGNGNDGTQSGGVEYASSGIIGNAAGFDGVDDVIIINEDSAFEQFSDELTISLWQKKRSVDDTGYNFLIHKAEGSGCPACDRWWIGHNTGAQDDDYYFAVTTVNGGANVSSAVNADADENEWVHIVGVYDGAFIRLYKDTVQIGPAVAQTGIIPADPSKISFGAESNNDGVSWLGFAHTEIDDVRIYNRALTTAEVNDLYIQGVGIGSWSQVGNSLSIGSTAVNTITALNGSTVATIEHVDDELITYEWDGTDWSQVGNALVIASTANPELTTIDTNTVAFTDGDNEELRTYSWDGTNWTQVGNSLGIPGMNAAGMTTLDTNLIAFMDQTLDELTTYSWDGTNWTQVGNSLSDNTFQPGLAALNSTTIALVDNDYLRTFSWDGTDWTQVGNTLVLDTNVPKITALDERTVAITEDNTNTLQIYKWDGTDWKPFGSAFTYGNGLSSITRLSDSQTIALMHSSGNELETYQFVQCTTPTRPEGTILYNDDGDIMQYCDGENWNRIGK